MYFYLVLFRFETAPFNLQLRPKTLTRSRYARARDLNTSNRTGFQIQSKSFSVFRRSRTVFELCSTVLQIYLDRGKVFIFEILRMFKMKIKPEIPAF